MILSGEEILKYLPHRDPFLFIDEVISLDEGKNIHAVMYIKNENVFLEGHFPGNPIVPGVILIEAMGQASGILGFKTMKKTCLLYTSPSPRDRTRSRMPSSA